MPDAPPHHRRTIRIRAFDYAQPGMYFLTIVTHGRASFFGHIVHGEIRLNDAGRIVHDEWLKSARMRPRVHLDQFIVMPNHFHGILVFMDARPTRLRTPAAERFAKPTSDSIPTIVRLFKSATTKRIHALQGNPAATIWQRNYYEHLIRDGDSLDCIRRYIADNPARWASDRENPQAVSLEPENAWALL
jgi:putative transposase